MAQVEQAIADLDRQRSQVRLSGRTFLVDLVMQTPDRFGSAVRTALELELPAPAARRLPGALPAQRAHRRPPGGGQSRRCGATGFRRRDPQGPRRPSRGGGRRRAGRGRHPGGHLRHRSPLQPTGGLRRPRQPRGRGDGGVPRQPVEQQRRGRRAGHPQQLVVPGRGGTRDRLPRDAARPRTRPEHPRGDRHRRPGQHHARGRTPRARRGALPGRGLLDRRRQHRDARGVPGGRTEAAGVRGPRPRRRQPRAAARRDSCRPCCTTTCVPTCGGPVAC